MVNLSVYAAFSPDRVESTSGVCSSVHALTAVFINYLAQVFLRGILTRWTQDGLSSFVGSVENSAYDWMSSSHSPALHDLSSGSHRYAISIRLHLLQTCPLWIQTIHLLDIVASFIPYVSLEVRGVLGGSFGVRYSDS